MKKLNCIIIFLLFGKVLFGQSLTNETIVLTDWTEFKTLTKLTDEILSEFKNKDYKAIIKRKRKLGQRQNKEEIISLVNKVYSKIQKFGIPDTSNIIVTGETWSGVWSDNKLNRRFLNFAYVFQDENNTSKSSKIYFTFSLGETPELKDKEAKLQSFWFLDGEITKIQFIK